MAKQAESIAQPDACLPVADGMALDQLLTKMRVAADMEYAHVMKDKTEQSLRTLGAEALWEVSQHVYAHAEEFVVQFKHRWREENAEFAERGLQFQQVRQGWHYLLTETETASVLVTTDRRHVIEVQGVELSVCGRLREQYPEAKLPALVYVTLLPWQGRVSWDGVLAYHAVPDKQREMLHKQLWPVYHQAVVVDHKHKLDAEKLAEMRRQATLANAIKGGADAFYFFRIERGRNLLNIEQECSWAEVGAFTTLNVPCFEDGSNCLAGGGHGHVGPGPYSYGGDDARERVHEGHRPTARVLAP